MQSSSLIVLFGLFAVIALVWFYAVQKPEPDTFIEALKDRFSVGEGTSIEVPLNCRVIAWRRTKLLPRFVLDQWARIGADDQHLYVKLHTGGPEFKIPLRDLELVDSRFFWTALLNFDVYEIDGVVTGRLFYPGWIPW